MTNALSPTQLIKRAAELVTKWQKQNPDIDPKFYGVRVDSRNGTIDDGNYGDPMRDDRPDWIKQDEVGWTRLK